MLEIYNENVHDLFVPPNQRQKGGLKVREDKGDVYVQDLTKIPVESYHDIEEQIQMGTSNRTIGATNMNATSSRAHTVTTITFSQTEMENGKPVHQIKSDINLVDLAGSERQSGTGASGERLKEGSNINKSLSFLGRCISILAEKSTGQGKNKNLKVPYRESKLTRILQNALGGNSKTSMIAALSPASVNYDETLSTLRYANQVKAIKNDAKVNESAHDKLIRELKEENERLKQMIGRKDTLHQESHMHVAENYKDKYYFMNINEDPLLTGQVKHIFKEGTNVVGKATKDHEPDIRIGGIGVSPNHCEVIFNKGNEAVQLIPNKEDPTKFKSILNGEVVDGKVQLAHGDNILFGNHNLFTVVFPGQEVTEEMQDYETIMKDMNKDIINTFTDGKADEVAKRQMEEMRSKMEEERRQLEEKLKSEQKKIQDDKKRLAKQMEAEKKKLLEKMKGQNKNSDEMAQLQEQLKKQQEESEKLKEEQRQKMKEFEAEKKKAIKDMETKKREDYKKEQEILQRKDLEVKLSKLIPQLNEVNEICQNLGRDSYNYEPKIEARMTKDGRTVSQVIVRAYPDKDKDFYNTLSYDEFVDKVFMIREKWENLQYDIENGDVTAEMEFEPDENEAEIFGLNIANEDKIIGNVYIFCDSMASLLETNHDIAPILNSKGETKGHITYSLIPTAFDEKGEKLNLTHYESVASLMNQTLQVEFSIHEAKGLPEKYCHDNYCSYTWVDEAGQKFETEKVDKDKNPAFKYKAKHDLFISNYLAENLQYAILMVSVYGKLSDEKMEGIVNDLAARPHTSALLKDQLVDNSNSAFYEDKGGHQDVMRIDEEDPSEEETSIKKAHSQKDMAKKMKELEKRLQKMQKENAKLKKDGNGGKDRSSCCTIF